MEDCHFAVNYLTTLGDMDEKYRDNLYSCVIRIFNSVMTSQLRSINYCCHALWQYQICKKPEVKGLGCRY